MSDVAALLKLAERCEREEPSRELDAAIRAAVWRIAGFNRSGQPKPFTRSIDAAVTLVPEGMAWSVSMDASGQGLVNKWGEISEDGRAKTPALALCSAALQARAAEAEQIEVSKTRPEGSPSPHPSPADPGGER